MNYEIAIIAYLEKNPFSSSLKRHVAAKLTP